MGISSNRIGPGKITDPDKPGVTRALFPWRPSFDRAQRRRNGGSYQGEFGEWNSVFRRSQVVKGNAFYHCSSNQPQTSISEYAMIDG